MKPDFDLKSNKAHGPYLDLEGLVGSADVPDTDVREGQSVHAVCLVQDRGRGPLVRPVLATILNDPVANPLVAARVQFDIVFGSNPDRTAEVPIPCVEDGDRVLAVVGELLETPGGKELQEPQLLAVCLERELKTRVYLFP